MSIESVMPSNHLILCCPLLLLPSFNPSQHQDLFQWVSSSHQVAKVLELQLQHQSFQRMPRAEFLRDWQVIGGCTFSSLHKDTPWLWSATTGHWPYLIYFYAVLSLVKMALFSRSLHFPTEKGKDPISLSSICSGNHHKVPTPREALPIGAEWYSAIQGPDKGDPAFL